MIKVILLATAYFAMGSQAEPEQWQLVLSSQQYSVAIRFDQPESAGRLAVTVITTDAAPPQSPPLTGQRWARIEVECADDRSGNGKIRLLGQGALEGASSPSPTSPGNIANPLVYEIAGNSPVSWVAENLCNGQMPGGMKITENWPTIPNSLREKHDAMRAAPPRISRF